MEQNIKVGGYIEREKETVLHDFFFQEMEIDVYEDDTKSNEKKSAKYALLLWCQKKSNGFL